MPSDSSPGPQSYNFMPPTLLRWSPSLLLFLHLSCLLLVSRVSTCLSFLAVAVLCSVLAHFSIFSPGALFLKYGTPIVLITLFVYIIYFLCSLLVRETGGQGQCLVNLCHLITRFDSEQAINKWQPIELLMIQNHLDSFQSRPKKQEDEI